MGAGETGGGPLRGTSVYAEASFARPNGNAGDRNYYELANRAEKSELINQIMVPKPSGKAGFVLAEKWADLPIFNEVISREEVKSYMSDRTGAIICDQ